MFHVRWVQRALDELAEIWMRSDSTTRQEITSASHHLDQELSKDPFSHSESRAGAKRIFFAYPLGAIIEVDLNQRIVWVLHAWRFRRRGQGQSNP